MITTPYAEPVPISLDTDQVIRVGGTRVTLDTIINSLGLSLTHLPHP